MTSRKIKRNLNKELMFNKIMPSSLSSVTSEHNNTVNVERAALKSEYVKNDAYEENKTEFLILQKSKLLLTM